MTIANNRQHHQQQQDYQVQHHLSLLQSIGMSNNPADIRAHTQAHMGLSRELQQEKVRESDPSRGGSCGYDATNNSTGMLQLKGSVLHVSNATTEEEGHYVTVLCEDDSSIMIDNKFCKPIDED
jgi:hypothetical protein